MVAALCVSIAACAGATPPTPSASPSSTQSASAPSDLETLANDPSNTGESNTDSDKTGASNSGGDTAGNDAASTNLVEFPNEAQSAAQQEHLDRISEKPLTALSETLPGELARIKAITVQPQSFKITAPRDGDVSLALVCTQGGETGLINVSVLRNTEELETLQFPCYGKMELSPLGAVTQGEVFKVTASTTGLNAKGLSMTALVYNDGLSPLTQPLRPTQIAVPAENENYIARASLTGSTYNESFGTSPGDGDLLLRFACDGVSFERIRIVVDLKGKDNRASAIETRCGLAESTIRLFEVSKGDTVFASFTSGSSGVRLAYLVAEYQDPAANQDD